MPLFVFAEFADYSLTWIGDHTLAVVFLAAGFLACACVALLWHDTRNDDRSELDDTAPRVSKVVQFKAEGRVFTSEDYRQMVDAQTRGEDPAAVIARINASWQQAEDELRGGLERRRAEKEATR